VASPPSADSPGLGLPPVAPQLTAHAPYSCHPSLLQALKERARQAGRLFPIHVAESAAEIEFLATGHGPFQQFLSERLRQFGALAEGQDLSELVQVPGCGAVALLHKLGLLDAQTICVHAVHISPPEADLLAQSKAKVCLCPASNRRLGVGIAKVAMLIERQILPGLGTDSLASNDCLDLWHEMQVLQEDHPGLAPELIFRLATLGGAETLGVAARLGSLAPGREAKLLAVDFSGPAAAVYPFLANTGQAIRLDWMEAANVSRG
jgi:cytosine/adenosine deaminase-related metal-dependent hydrolase